MELQDIKIGDKLREKATGEIWEVAQTSPSIWLTKGEFADMVSDVELDLYEHEFYTDGLPIQYNELSCKRLVETLKAFSELNKVDIDDFSILKSTYDPKNGSMTFSIKIN